MESMNRQVICWNKTFATHLANRRSVSGVFQKLSTNKEKIVPSLPPFAFPKVHESTSRNLTEEEMRMTNKHVEKMLLLS